LKEPTDRDALLRRTEPLEEEARKRRLAEHFARAVLDSLSAHIAILDEHGVIMGTNKAWREFASANDVRMRPDMVGVNYLHLCDGARGDSAEGSGEVARGIRAVLNGELEELAIDYPCHSPREKRWFYMRVTRLSEDGPLRLVVSHENITALKKAEEELKRREGELERRSRSLQEANTALKVLLRQREEDRRELEEKVLSNVKELVLPYLERLVQSRLDARQRQWLDLARSRLTELTSPFMRNLSARYADLTPREIQVADSVRSGKATKEIAELLGISTQAVDFHRKNIRRKLGLSGRGTNLRSFLLSLS